MDGTGTERFLPERGPFFPRIGISDDGLQRTGVHFGEGRSWPAMPLHSFTQLGELERALRRFAIVIAEHAAEAFPTPNIANFLADFVSRINDPIPETLMISYPLIMGYEFL